MLDGPRDFFGPSCYQKGSLRNSSLDAFCHLPMSYVLECVFQVVVGWSQQIRQS